MRIGIFDPYLDDNGGGERYMMTIASALSKENQIEVFWDEEKDLDQIKERFEIDLSKVHLTKNIFRLPPQNKYIESKKFDVIIALSDGSIPFLLSKKLFLHIQQPVGDIRLNSKDKLKLKRVSKIFVNSKFTKEFVDKVYGVNSLLLYPPVSIFGNKTKKENIILHVGRFRVLNVKATDYKKQQVMVDTFKEMVDSGLTGWKFVLAVSLPDEKDERFVEMKKSAEGYPIEFLINSSKDKLWKFGSKAKIYWHASGFGEDLKANPQLAEHFGISTVEAMGAGAVPVVINAGGQKEIVTNGVNGFLWDSLDELKKRTLELMNNSVLWERLSKKAYEDSKVFSEDKFSKSIQEIIK